MTQTIQVTRTYLEMGSPLDLYRGATPLLAPKVERASDCPISLYRYLYSEVGRRYHWTDRLDWSDETIRRHLENPDITLWIARWQTAPAGYFELKQHEDRSVEIAYFGLLPDFVGRGWGRTLLARAVDEAWNFDVDRVWLSTCTLDHPAALPNYLRRGFKVIREEVYTATIATPATDR